MKININPNGKKIKNCLKVALTLGGLSLAAVIFILILFLLKFMWGWVIPDIFPGAVAQGLIVGKISWYTSMKVALFFAVISAFTSSGKD